MKASFLQMKLFPQIKDEERASINERLHLFAKDEKRVPFFITWLLCGQGGKGHPFFINFAVTQKD